jgi:hypothetical protein
MGYHVVCTVGKISRQNSRQFGAEINSTKQFLYGISFKGWEQQ